MIMSLTNGKARLMAGLLAVLLTAAQASAVTYNEVNGRVVIEAEAFDSRTQVPATLDLWTIVPGESAPAGPAATNVRGSGYVQSLPDSAGGGGGQGNPPTIEYKVQINNPGTYSLYLRWDGNATDATLQGQSDSIFADIVELKDGPGGAIADHYEFNHAIDGNFNSIPWDNQGGFELNTAGGTPKVAANFDITSAGVYTVRVSQREDGSRVDSIILQQAALPAPTGFGPAPSILADQVELANLLVNADAHVQSGAATTNFGSDGNVLVKNAGAGSGTNRKGYFRFDVSGIDLTSLVNAQLELEVSSNNGGGSPLGPPQEYIVNVFGLNDGAGEAWTENTINFSNAPGNAADSTLNPATTTLLGQFGVPALDPGTNDPIFVSFNNLLSANPDAFLNFLAADTDGSVTFILTRATVGGNPNLGFFSKENTAGGQAAHLRLFAQQIPEPSTGLLALAGVAALAARRRHRAGA